MELFISLTPIYLFFGALFLSNNTKEYKGKTISERLLSILFVMVIGIFILHLIK